ncbi:MAG: CsbD family protein [Phaeodactylibacter sp.]|nr:CsbD family protein [Phaeodactylibacter sp.]
MSAFTDIVKGNWNQIKGELKQKYGQLTDNDLVYEEGQEDELMGRLQEKLGKTKEQVKDLIDGIGSSN